MASLRQQVNAFISETLSPTARSQQIAEIAIKARADLIASKRASSSYRTFVDGREGAPETAVRGAGGGTIVYLFSYEAEAVVYALAFLRQRSPVRSGTFQNSFWVSVNGRYIAPGQFNPASVPPGAEIAIGNTQPYNRKVDVQLVGTKRLRFSVPAGLFDDAARAVTRQFRGTLKARRIYTVQFPGQYVLKGRKRRAGNQKGRVHSPALIISQAA